MTVFDDLHSGSFYNIKNKDYQIEVHGEIDRCDDLCHRINLTAPKEKADIAMMEHDLFHTKDNGSYITPPLYIDCGNQVKLGNNVYINHNVTMMSLGKITIDDNVMIGPGVGLFTVNHKAKATQMIMTKSIHIKKGAWVGARVNVLPGVTIGENSIIGTGSVVTKDIPDNAVAVGNPAKVIKNI